VVIGSNVFNLAALLRLAAVVAGWIGFHRRVVVLAGVPGVRDCPGHRRGTRRRPPGGGRVPAAAIAAASVLLLTGSPRLRTVAVGPGGLWRRESVLPGWSIGRLWRLNQRHRS
jgi:hypothetical protein